MSDCPSLILTLPATPSASVSLTASPSLSFYAATQVPGLALPLTAAQDLAGPSFVSITTAGLVMAQSFPALPASAFVRNSVTSGSQVYVLTDGLLNGFAGLSIGDTYFLGTGGQPTSVMAVSGISQQLAVAVAADTLLVQIQPPVYLV